MVILYFLVIKIYELSIFLASPFNKKAAKWVAGRNGIFRKLKQTFDNQSERPVWFHCSSLGEFEQGKPLMLAIKQQYPSKKILLTFFSPSGFENKKNDAAADYIFYLPMDGPVNARKFVESVNPSAAFFVKYEFWHFYIRQLKVKNIPCYSVAATFRSTQIYFMWYGKFFKKILQRMTMLFVQNQESLVLLYKKSLPHVTVSGDTRFDRVFQNALAAKSFPEIERFVNGKKVFIAGSTWPDDVKLIAQLINESDSSFKFIIAPHEIKEPQIAEIVSLTKKKCVRYSQLQSHESNAEVLIIDNIGMLASIYKYADVAYIGGGFNNGIHNILEAVVFGPPVIFGPYHQKFNEAVELKKAGGAFAINNQNDLNRIFTTLKNPEEIQRINSINKKFIAQHKGATDVIMNYLKMNW